MFHKKLYFFVLNQSKLVTLIHLTEQFHSHSTFGFAETGLILIPRAFYFRSNYQTDKELSDEKQKTNKNLTQNK